MATRTSLYGSVASMIPDWAFGGEYGDLTKLMNNRELSYEQLWQQQENTRQEQQQTRLNQQQILNNERDQAVADALDQQFSTQRPTNLRDAYESMITAALDSGDAGTALKAMEAMNGLDRNEESRKVSMLNQLDSLPYSVLRTAYGETLPVDEKTANAIYNRRRGGGPGGRNYIMQGPNGQFELVPEGLFNERAAQGYKPKSSGSTDPFEQMMMYSMGMSPDFVPGEGPAQQQKDLVSSIRTNAPGDGAEVASRDMYLKKDGRKIFVKAGERIPK